MNLRKDLPTQVKIIQVENVRPSSKPLNTQNRLIQFYNHLQKQFGEQLVFVATLYFVCYHDIPLILEGLVICMPAKANRIHYVSCFDNTPLLHSELMRPFVF